MDYKTRLSLALTLGLAVGFGLGYFFGNQMALVFISLAVAVAVETSLRAGRDVKSRSKTIQGSSIDIELKNTDDRLKPPVEPKF